MSDQDWTPVVLSKTNKQKTAGLNSAQVIRNARLTGAVTTEKKFGKISLFSFSLEFRFLFHFNTYRSCRK